MAGIERFIGQIGAELELRGAKPSAFRRVRDRIQARGANAASGELTPLEEGLAADVNLINSAHANPAFKELIQHSTRGGMSASGARRRTRRRRTRQRGSSRRMAVKAEQVRE